MSYSICIHFSLPLSCLLCTEALSAHVWSMALMSGGDLTHTVLLNRMESKAFQLISSPLTDCLDSLSHFHNVASLSIFYHYFHADCSLNMLSACLPPSHGLIAQDFLLLLIPILSIFLMQELTSIFTLSSPTLVISGTLFLCLFFHLPIT